MGAIVACAVEHCALLDGMDFPDFVVSIKDSDPRLVIDANTRFAEARPDVPIHLGVTEAGMPPEGIIKTRIAFEQLLSRGIGDTLRVSLTVPFDDKGQEIEVGRQIIEDVSNGRFRSVPPNFFDGLNIIACPSCSRVENEKFIDLAEDVKRMTEDAKEHDITIAVMGCRVNGPGETDDAGPRPLVWAQDRQSEEGRGHGRRLRLRRDPRADADRARPPHRRTSLRGPRAPPPSPPLPAPEGTRLILLPEAFSPGPRRGREGPYLASAPMKILVVEDNPKMARSIEMTLTESGFEVETVGPGRRRPSPARDRRPTTSSCWT